MIPERAKPRIELIEATEADRPVIESLAQLYQYDFSEMSRHDTERGNHGNVGEDGRFHGIDFDYYYGKEGHHEFLVRVDGFLAGFVLVAPGRSYRRPSEKVWNMDEFFVMRRYRRLGVGSHVARMVFDRFPGAWQVAEMSINTGAQAFWRRVIGSYTGGRYEEVHLDSDDGLGPVQYFESGRP